MEGFQYIINSDRKAELYIGYDKYKALPDNVRKDIKSYFLFSRPKGAWISKGGYNNYSVIRIIDELKIPLGGREERKTFEEKQSGKIEKAVHRIDRFEKYSTNASKRAEQLQSEFNRLRKDWSWLTQPIIRGHSGSERFGRQKEKVLNRYDKGFEEYRKSDYFKGRAETARNTAEQNKLRDAVYLSNKIKEANQTIKKVSSWVEKYQGRDNSNLIKQYGEEKVNNWIMDGLEKLQEGFEKLAFFSAHLDSLKSSGRTVYDKETLQNAKFVKIRGSWHLILRLNPTTITHSWFAGSFKHPYSEVQDVIFKNENVKVEPGRIAGDYNITKIAAPEKSKKPWKKPNLVQKPKPKLNEPKKPWKKPELVSKPKTQEKNILVMQREPGQMNLHFLPPGIKSKSETMS
jgi:hypothetical protein